MQVLKKIEKGTIFLFYPEKWNTLGSDSRRAMEDFSF